jgi:hypothetical protein
VPSASPVQRKNLRDEFMEFSWLTTAAKYHLSRIETRAQSN